MPDRDIALARLRRLILVRDARKNARRISRSIINLKRRRK